jgi:hypothetical protein
VTGLPYVLPFTLEASGLFRAASDVRIAEVSDPRVFTPADVRVASAPSEVRIVQT